MNTRHINTVATIFTLCLLAMISACGQSSTDNRLLSVDETAAADPHLAMEMLDSIDQRELDDYNHHYYDFLKIKTADKAYVRHTSDSLYKEVARYFEAKKNEKLYPEVVYYGGRVYSDLGDYPRALEYFQKSLELIPKDKANIQLRLNALSQTGRLLNTLRLYEDAIPYLKQVVDIDILMKDSLNIFYDYELLANVYKNNKDYRNAYLHLKKASSFLNNDSSIDIDLVRGEMALLKFFQGDNDSALHLIKGLPEKINHNSLGFLLSGASRIYMAAGIYDTAYLYAKRIKDSKDLTWSRSGYQVLLSPGVVELSPTDTINLYLKEYLKVLEKIYNDTQRDSYLLQNSFYNYSIYQRENSSLSKHNNNLAFLLWISIIIIILFFLGFVTIKYKNLRQSIKLHDALLEIIRINNKFRPGNELSDIKKGKGVKELSQIFEHEINFLNTIFKQPENQTNPYHSTPGFELAQEHLIQNQILKESDWKTIYESIETVSPGFFIRIRHISDSLSEEDIRLLSLIRIGINATSVAVLMAKSKGTVTYRRRKLLEKLNLTSIKLENIDTLIKLI